MKVSRRGFFQVLGLGAAGAVASPDRSDASSPSASLGEGMGMLVDTTECIGCRKCEYACDHAHELTGQPPSAFEDLSTLDTPRRMDEDSFTVVNRYPNPDNPEKPISVKIQCMHCLRPACTSACLVGALQVAENGAVVYEAWKCLGCRYCMVACPFGVPTYEYHEPFTPQVRKCTFCHERVTHEGKIPACAEMCPPMALTFGQRSELLELAHKKIADNPERYINHVYGEHEVGGTSWLYLAPREFEELGFLKLGPGALPSLTEPIQHAIFKFGIPPLTLYGLLGAMMWAYRNGDDPPVSHDMEGETNDA
ncbi:MAG: 4Fe-4S dicluster domain-containing protein [Candidatus Omnitrophica bacterium]|nr:4Fe-4S dicluster domain-containing protein [Candidatus Omnitrophota bacterium]